jgi:hypothetical protein
MVGGYKISQYQRLAEIDWFVHAMMLNSLDGFFIEKIKAEGIFICIDRAEQSVAKEYPLLLANLAFEDGFLNSYTVVLARLCHAAETPLSGIVGRRDVVGNQNEHR